MNKSLVTESADELYDKAERDIMTVDSLISQPKYPIDLMYDIICYHATQAVEKFLKGYIISNGKNIEKIHNLDYLHQAATLIDGSFSKIANDCLILNTYLPEIRYSNKNQLAKQDIDKIIKSLENVCNFLPIKTMRDSFNKNHKYEIITEAN